MSCTCSIVNDMIEHSGACTFPKGPPTRSGPTANFFSYIMPTDWTAQCREETIEKSASLIKIVIKKKGMFVIILSG